jgi:hypothetical protein
LRFRAKHRHALLWVRSPPINFCNFTSDARTRSRASDSRPFDFPRKDSKPHSSSVALFTEQRPSPLEEEQRVLRAATVFPLSASWRCKHVTKHDRGSHHPIVAPLAGDALTRPPLAVGVVWMTTLDCTGRLNSERRTTPQSPAAAVRLRQRFPSSVEFLEHLLLSSALCTEGWMLPPSA